MSDAFSFLFLQYLYPLYHLSFPTRRSSDLKATSYMAVGFYVAKYVNKKSDMDLAAKGLGAKEWNNSLKTNSHITGSFRSQERFSRNAETDIVCRLLLEKKNVSTKWMRYR